MKASDRLKIAVSALDSACRAVINEKRRPIDRQISLLQSLRFEQGPDASRLVAEAMTSDDPLPLLLRAAACLQEQDRTDTAASLRGTAVEALQRKADAFEAELKPVIRVRQIVGPLCEMATKAVISRASGAGDDYVTTSIVRHVNGNVEAAYGAIEEVRKAFPSDDVGKAADEARDAFSGILDTVLEAEGV